MFYNVVYIPFCLVAAAAATAEVAGDVPVAIEDQPNASPYGIGSLCKALANIDLTDPARFLRVLGSTIVPDLLALVAAAVFFYFLNYVLVVPKKRSKPREEDDSEEELTSPDSEISGCTSLHLAAHNGQAGVIEALLDSGLEVNAVDNYNETALHMAARAGRADICSMLLDAGADPDVENKNLKTAFIIAALSGHADVCKLLQPGKVNRRPVPAKEKPPPTLDSEEPEVNAGSDCSTESTDGLAAGEEGGFGCSELHGAALRCSLGQVNVLLRDGPDVNRCDPWGEAALHLAARAGSLEVCAALCAARADLAVKNKDHKSALDVAAFSQHRAICKLLEDFS